MKQISSSEFRRKYATLNEPTEVLAFDALIGTWIPKGATVSYETSTAEGSSFTVRRPVEAPVTEAEPQRMTIRPAHAPQRRLVGHTKRVLDPTELRRQARTRDEEVTPRQFMRRKGN